MGTFLYYKDLAKLKTGGPLGLPPHSGKIQLFPILCSLFKFRLDLKLFYGSFPARANFSDYRKSFGIEKSLFRYLKRVL